MTIFWYVRCDRCGVEEKKGINEYGQMRIEEGFKISFGGAVRDVCEKCYHRVLAECSVKSDEVQ